jgi:hypothetical protein
VAQTNTLPAGSTAYYEVSVPANAVWATNSMYLSSGPLNLLFNQNGRPDGTNGPGDYTLLSTSVDAAAVLGTNTAPVLMAGKTYYLAVQNTNGFAVTYGIGVNFDLEVATNVEIGSVTVGDGGTTLRWNAPTNDEFEVEWTTNLVPPVEWSVEPGIVTSTTGMFQYTDTSPPTGMKFYRLLQIQ